MKKTKYTPQAGDVCDIGGISDEVLIISPEPTSDGCYIAYDVLDFEVGLKYPPWYCDINELKLIYRP